MAQPQLAIALRYDPSIGAAPTVTARGTALLAQRIEAMAHDAGIPIHRDAGLATILARLEIASPIPPALFAAVAEILAHLYCLDAQLRREGAGDAATASSYIRDRTMNDNREGHQLNRGARLEVGAAMAATAAARAALAHDGGDAATVARIDATLAEVARWQRPEDDLLFSLVSELQLLRDALGRAMAATRSGLETRARHATVMHAYGARAAG